MGLRRDYYKEHFARHFTDYSQDRINKVFALAAGLKCDRLLDIGCGDGALAVALGQRVGAKKLFGIEISAEGARLSSQRGIQVVSMDLDEDPLPLEDEFADLVYLGDIIEHVFDPGALLAEVHRVLKVQGRCLVTTPNLASWYNRAVFLLGYQPYGTAASLRHATAGKARVGSEAGWGGEHIRVMTLRAFRELVALCGFRVERAVGARGVLPPSSALHRTASLLDTIACRRLSLATWIVALLKKQTTEANAAQKHTT